MNAKGATMKIRSTGLVVLAVTALTACKNEVSAPDPGASPTGEASPVSILRPDVEQPPQEPRLSPLEVRIGFPEGGAELSEDALTNMAEAFESPQMAEGGTIVLRGHSDAGGSDDANIRASQARAEAVRGWLVEQGVARDRISVIAFGEQNPIQPNALPDGAPNEAGRAANRRVDITVNVDGSRSDALEASANDGETEPS